MYNSKHQLRTYTSDSHDDFKPKTKISLEKDNLEENVRKIIASDKIVVFMKGVPEAPECGFSRAVCQVLNFYGFKYTTFNVNQNLEYKEPIKKIS